MSFIRSLAEVEKLSVSTTEETLQAALFGDSPAAQTAIALVDGRPIAYVIYYFTFASTVGQRGLWVDDVFVDSAHRGKGIGEALMAYLADLAVQNGCARFEWAVLNWNEPAVRFYEQLGATILEDWRICRLEGKEIQRVAGKLTTEADDQGRAATVGESPGA